MEHANLLQANPPNAVVTGPGLPGLFPDKRSAFAILPSEPRNATNAVAKVVRPPLKASVALKTRPYSSLDQDVSVSLM
jgi:hypothetical protein